MSALNTIVQISSAIVAGGIVGIVFGFSMASHEDVLRGVRPHTENRIILFLARPTSEFSSLESVLFVFFMLAWWAVFFALCALPAIVSSQFSDVDLLAVEIVYVVFLLAGWLGRKFGAHAWKVMS